MAHRVPARTAIRRTGLRRVRIVGLLVAVAAIVVALGGRWPTLPSSSISSAPPSGSPGRTIDAVPGEGDGAMGESAGAIPAGTTAFDDELPGVGNLDPVLLAALRRAAVDAGDAGVELQVTSGWRSPEYQQGLLDEGIAKYGSEREAARWVATPETSAHVSGDAVDIGPLSATDWLAQHGARYGLCQIYANESWHYELRPDAVDHGCPATYADATEDPRMRG